MKQQQTIPIPMIRPITSSGEPSPSAPSLWLVDWDMESDTELECDALFDPDIESLEEPEDDWVELSESELDPDSVITGVNDSDSEPELLSELD